MPTDRSDMDIHILYNLLSKGTEKHFTDSIYMVLVINHDYIQCFKTILTFSFSSHIQCCNGDSGNSTIIIDEIGR